MYEHFVFLSSHPIAFLNVLGCVHNNEVAEWGDVNDNLKYV